jgi:glucuronokinase
VAATSLAWAFHSSRHATCAASVLPVPQVYGGVVCMDFDQQHMEASGCGIYESLDPALLPRLWLVWCDNPSDSGRVHSTVKQRWLAGDASVRDGMQRVAECADKGR